ncbi:DUF3086 domain-containing protein [Roseofilum casamattae]|uniref:DUF3086 domain-containing protein n=1 Tax=Roseofilum casamattae BLCC-M143 TaxID=3022442 RepID=A0ABT7BSY1_9CYAN|nr:DUF3086 domain-containing protein [Roseofilum casamattae]MDJ1182297.1 DUF3086 domain-containing protein [Roseofilum casamattae BLCC-M143]
MTIDPYPDGSPEVFPPQSPEAEGVSNWPAEDSEISDRQPDGTSDTEDVANDAEDQSLETPATAETLLPLQLDTNTPHHPEPREESAENDRLNDINDTLSDRPSEVAAEEEPLDAVQSRIEELRSHEAALNEQVQGLRKEAEALENQLAERRSAMDQLVQAGVSELEHRKQHLEITIEKLEKQADRIRGEMRTSFAGVSQDLAIRVQGFKDYLVGSLQDLASAAENIELAPEQIEVEPAYREPPQREARGSARPRREDSRGGRDRPRERNEDMPSPQFAQQKFNDQVRKIRQLLDRYRTRPDYYGPAWQLRRTFEPIHAERVSQWFLTQGGRGAVRSMGSRLQNILVASATISVMHSLYGDRLRPLILVNTPERLGEWRRGLQDCLGISRSDFSSERGIVMFEAPEALAAKADRIVQQKQLPLIIIDESEDKVSVSMLQFPLWLAFAPNPDGPTGMDTW